MSNYFQISLFAGAMAIGSLMAPAAYADKPNLMVVSDDANKDTSRGTIATSIALSSPSARR